MDTSALRRGLGSALLGAAAAAAGPARADVVDFERTPGGGLPVDNAALAEAYAIAGGGTVRFYFDRNADNAFDPAVDALPVFEQVGNADPQNGFFNFAQQVYDVPRADVAARLGGWFLRQPVSLSAVPASFIVDYDTPQRISALSGEIWDIDGISAASNERWRVEVLDASGAVLASQLSPDGTEQAGPYDAAPWTFAFTNLPLGVDKVRLTYIGAKPDAIGLAFDNFSPTVAVVPEPGSAALALAGLALLGLRARRLRR